MTTDDLRNAINQHEAAGHTKVPVDISVLLMLIIDAERQRKRGAS